MELPRDTGIDAVIELVRAGKVRLLERRPYVVNGKTLTEYRFEWVEPPAEER